MFLRQISDPHLAQYSYIIGCQRSGEAIVIDPERDIARYREIADAEGLRITAVAETHIHADFVSGAREFAETDSSVKIYVSAEGGPDWQSEWAKSLPSYHPLKDGDTFSIGNIEFQAIHTPGHTPEHMVYLVTDRGGGANEPIAMLSGDFIFVGDAGRPDLLEQAAGLEGTQEQGARALYKSLRKVSELPCHVQILPAHGAGSACGKALGAIPNSTFGYEEKFNPALKLALNSSEEQFVNFILSGQPEPPAYFANMKRVNKIGPNVLEKIPQPIELSLEDVTLQMNAPDVTILDTRSRDAFLAGHLRGSLFAPPEKFSDFAGSYLQPEDKIILVIRDVSEWNDFALQLIRIGFDHIIGFIPSYAIDAAPASLKESIQAVRFADMPEIISNDGKFQYLDVRKATEFQKSHVRTAKNIAHTRLCTRIEELDPAKRVIVSCATGTRAAGACALLAKNGRNPVCVADKFENVPSEILE
jgi:hydroxyacylglutathione hydrolase